MAAAAAAAAAAVLAVVPEEIIIEEILIRLSLRSVVRFRCVCKSWNSLLCNPDYLSQFMVIKDSDCLISMYKYNNNNNNNNRIDNDIPSPCDLFILSIGSGKQLSETRIDNNNYVPYPLSLSKYNIHLVGSINGLVCMALEVEGGQHDQFILWNPTIRFSKTILVPKHLPEVEGLQLDYLEGYGFGWNSMTNDYILIISPWEDCWSSVVVYSSNTNRWSYIKYPESTNIFSWYFKHPRVIVNGSPYWNDWQEDHPILKFDTRNNEFTCLDAPDSVYCDYTLINLNDCLALIDFSRSTPTVYRFDEEDNIWMHMYTLAERVNNIEWRWGDEVCCFKYGGEIVFHGKKHLYMYDPKSHKIKHRRHPRCRGCPPLKSHKHKCRGSHDCEGFYHVNGVSYIPSLVALRGMKALHL